MMIRTSLSSMLMALPGAAWMTSTMVPADEGAGGSSASPYDDTELKSFATAAVKVQMISDAYSRKMGDTPSDAEKKQLQRSASNEMVQAVKNEGLSVDKYQSIAKRIDTDPDLARRIRDKLSSAA